MNYVVTFERGEFEGSGKVGNSLQSAPIRRIYRRVAPSFAEPGWVFVPKLRKQVGKLNVRESKVGLQNGTRMKINIPRNRLSILG